ncbi:hypothetical protein [Dankookia sp. P2]|uniref:hypothetical protein n=1 Tax=Dankookia sp. P2 TaxID=3423955 RepID=UPI003D66B580
MPATATAAARTKSAPSRSRRGESSVADRAARSSPVRLSVAASVATADQTTAPRPIARSRAASPGGSQRPSGTASRTQKMTPPSRAVRDTSSAAWSTTLAKP